MKKFKPSLWAGIVLGLAMGILGSAVAQDKGEIQSFLIAQVDRLVQSHCTAYVGYGYGSLRNRCNSNEVMTGTDGNGGIICSNLTIECFNKQVVLTPEN